MIGRCLIIGLGGFGIPVAERLDQHRKNNPAMYLVHDEEYWENKVISISLEGEYITLPDQEIARSDITVVVADFTDERCRDIVEPIRAKFADHSLNFATFLGIADLDFKTNPVPLVVTNNSDDTYWALRTLVDCIQANTMVGIEFQDVRMVLQDKYPMHAHIINDYNDKSRLEELHTDGGIGVYYIGENKALSDYRTDAWSRYANAFIATVFPHSEFNDKAKFVVIDNKS